MIEINYLKEKGRKAITEFLQWNDKNGCYTDENSDIEGVERMSYQDAVKYFFGVINSEYGKDRNFKDDGGCVIVVEKEADFEEIKHTAYIDCEDSIPEYVDKILCSNGESYTNSLILCNNDYAISLIIPMELTSEIQKNYIID